MQKRVILLALALLAPALVHAQQHGNAALVTTAPREAKQFDFLVGQWELTVTPKVSSLAARIHGAPRMIGTWKAWRAFDGFGIEDEMRIVDRSGNPVSLSHTLRIFSTADGRWLLTGLDVYRTRFATTTAEWKNGEMTVMGKGVDGEGKTYMTRSRFHAIRSDRFSFQQDRSTDNGRTWEEATLRIEAKRSAGTAAR